jgi:hypothetical protein
MHVNMREFLLFPSTSVICYNDIELRKVLYLFHFCYKEYKSGSATLRETEGRLRGTSNIRFPCLLTVESGCSILPASGSSKKLGCPVFLWGFYYVDMIN